ncbi:synaptotagmin-like protein 3 isoform X2 [Loxodonta africana]|uniref:synaptotagmin-like protein 3 isoform X2 n=1 Tax=Loxodonta africana TaxID=9785 RepID=UPI0030D55C03
MAQEVNLNSLKDLEREVILQVLYRDQAVQNVEEERIRKLKTHLQHLRWKGAKSTNQDYREKSCARCQRALGLLLNRGAVCRGCSYRVCAQCRVFLRKTHAWKCTVCFEDRNVKIKSGQWFFEERAKKFPTEGKHRTAGAKLLQSYQKPSKISVVPPTPPPHSENQCGSQTGLQELGQFKGFNKSVENLFLSVTTHMKKLSKSQNDMTSDKHHLATGHRQSKGRSERRSQSDTAINVTTRVSSPDILKSLNQEDSKHSPDPVSKQQDSSSNPAARPLFSGELRHGSLISINSTCTEMGNFDNANVTGEIEFAIRYCFKTHSLEICIKACKNLAYGEEKKKKCNPYIKIYLLPDRSSQGKRKTRVQKNTTDPIFQETLKYQVDPAQLAVRRLQVSVWHLGTLTRRVFLGEVLIPLAMWDFGDSATQAFCWYPLRPKAETCEDSVPHNNGELALRAKLVLPSGPRKLPEAQEGTDDQPPLNGQLCLVVLGAKNLPVRSDGTLNSFVKGCLTLPNQQKLRLKSPVLKKQACPQWKHSFVFSGVTTSQLRQSSLELTVWDQAIFGMNDRLLGGARLGSKEEPASGTDSCSPSKLQWQKVLSNPNLWTDMTLVLH